MARTKEEIIARLKQLQSPTPSQWREKAEWQRANRLWIRHSQQIAMMVLSKLDELHMTQKALAEKLGCSQQYVSKIVKGQENLSLETIAKLEEALQLSFFVSPYHYSEEEESEPAMAADEES